MIKIGQLFRFARRERFYLRNGWSEKSIEQFLNINIPVAITAHTCDVAIETMTKIRDGFEAWECKPVKGEHELKKLNNAIAEFEWVKAEYIADHILK